MLLLENPGSGDAFKSPYSFVSLHTLGDGPLATPSGENPVHKYGLAVLKDGNIDRRYQIKGWWENTLYWIKEAYVLLPGEEAASANLLVI